MSVWGSPVPERGNAENGTDAWRSQGRRVRDMFASLAPAYDLQNRLFSLGQDMRWRRRLVGGIRLESGSRDGAAPVLLDLAAGTLDVSLLARRRFPLARILAPDLCAPMLREGLGRKTGPEDRRHILPLIADARVLPLPDACVQAVTIAFGIRNMIPRQAVLAEARRILHPGGSLHVLEFAPVRAPCFGALYHWYLERAMPVLAGWLSGGAEAFRYLNATIRSFPDPEAFAREIEAAGLRVTETRSLCLGIAHIHRAVKD
jgi:demethylmenaquinone methyltransferase/2-methoxy-6-polyprenyl-1,4-benzoquinol methylase